jgi:hypothetical protein
MDSNRLKRPSLERVSPVRTWHTLFGPPRADYQAAGPLNGGAETARQAPAGAESPGDSTINPMLADAVQGGYRVINEYMRQAQAAAQGFSPAATNSGPTSASPDLQQLSQRMMQYVSDFVALWFEMSTKTLGNSTGWTPPFPPPVPAPIPTFRVEARQQPAAPKPNGAAAASSTMRLGVSVVSSRRTATALEFRPEPATALVVQPLQPQGHAAPVIDDVTVESPGGADALTVRVVVSENQPPGVYNGMIVERVSHLPRGTVSVRVYGDEER